MPSLWTALAPLKVRIDDWRWNGASNAVSSEFTRVTTTVVLHGGEAVGHGEDVTYTTEDHDDFPGDEMLAGTWTLDEYSRRLDELVLWAAEPDDGGVARLPALGVRERRARSRASAGGASRFADAVGRPYRPVRFVASTTGEDRPVSRAGPRPRVQARRRARTGTAH